MPGGTCNVVKGLARIWTTELIPWLPGTTVKHNLFHISQLEFQNSNLQYFTQVVSCDSNRFR